MPLACPVCGEAVDAPERDAGRLVVCPHCGKWVALVREGERAPARVDARSWLRGSAGRRDGIAALVLGVLSLLALGIVFGPLAIHYGSRAMNDPGQRTLGRIGRCLGLIGIGFMLFWIWLFLFR